MRVGWGWGGDDRVCVDSIDSFRVCYKFAAVLFHIHTIQTSPEQIRISALHDIYQYLVLKYRVCLQNQLTDRILMWYLAGGSILCKTLPCVLSTSSMCVVGMEFLCIIGDT